MLGLSPKAIVLGIRSIQLAFSVAILGLSGYVANWYNTDTLTSSPSQINFLIFAALWSLLSIACLEIVPRFYSRVSNPYGFLAIEFTNVLFWFAGFVALGVFLSQLLFCRGSVCAAAQADTAFAAFMFVTWVATVGILAKDVFKAGFRRPTPGGGVPKSVVGGSGVAGPSGGGMAMTKETMA
ncbi:membrane-associating domain-containing protein [Bombardia bombarda]|uniref:Membrane-associating domain-containing protein n=1 Tax=Bombardia bombarda TaxID=252184 RepID=A0AA39XKN7_9PEZI|nr:membrane-associating domain-containing protein [Bombardia bombarda]